MVRSSSEVRLHSKDLKVDQRSVSLTPLELEKPLEPVEENSNAIPEERRTAAPSGRQAVGHYQHASSDANFRGLPQRSLPTLK